MKKIFISYLFVNAGILSAQDIHFSQYFESPVTLSPALTGTDKSYMRANLNYRNQWSIFGKGYQTTAFSFDMPLLRGKKKGSYLGAGLQVLNDKAGTTGLGRLNVAGSLSSILKVGGNSLLSFGVQGSFNQRSINTGNVRWDNQFDGAAYNASLPSNETSGSQKKTFFDLGAGVAFIVNGNTDNMTSGDNFEMIIGAGAYHLTQPNVAFQGTDKTNMRYNGFLKMNFGLGSSNISLQPTAGYWRQGTLQEINLGTYLRYQLKSESQFTGFERGMAVSLGTFYRVNDAFFPILTFDYADYSIGISYDINLSSLSPYSQGRGGFEIYLRFRDLNGIFGQSGMHKTFL